MPYVENWPEFCERQDCEYLPVNGQVIFHNGATATMDTLIRCDPPTDPGQLATLKKLFLGEKLRQEVEDFHKFKDECLQAIQFARSNWNSPPPPINAKQQLEAGAKRIEALQAEIASLEVDYLATPEGQTAVAREVFQQQRQQQLGELENEVMSVTVNVGGVTQHEQQYQKMLAVQQAAQEQSLQFWKDMLRR